MKLVSEDRLARDYYVELAFEICLDRRYITDLDLEVCCVCLQLA